MGRIGRAVAVRARAFRMDLVAFDTVVDAEFDREHGIRRLSLDELLRVLRRRQPAPAPDRRHPRAWSIATSWPGCGPARS